MMSLPFFGLFAALVLLGLGHRRPAMAVWGLSIVVLLALYHAHATDTLDIVL